MRIYFSTDEAESGGVVGRWGPERGPDGCRD